MFKEIATTDNRNSTLLGNFGVQVVQCTLRTSHSNDKVSKEDVIVFQIV